MKKSFKQVLVSLLCFAMMAAMVPFAGFAMGAEETIINIGSGGSVGGGGEINASYVGGIGGKAYDDTAYTYTFNETPTASSKRYQYDITEYSAGTDEFTYEFNMYADGDASAWICYDGGYSLLTWKSDGTLLYNYDGTMTEWGKLSRGQWHRVAISYRTGRRFVYYVDGNYISDYSKWIAAPSTIGFGYDTGSANGVVAYDDMIKYKELYNNHHSQPYYTAPSLTSVSKAVKIADNVVGYDADIITSSEALLCDITSSDTNAIRLYTDSTHSALISEDTHLTGNEAIVVESADKAYSYYTLDNTYIAPAMERVQLVKAEDDNNDPNDNWIVNVKLTDDSVAVYSHTENKSWRISSDNLIAILSSKTGYELSYVDANKEESATNHVTDGFIKAVKGENIFYIPIIKSYDYERGYSTNKAPNINVRYRNAYGQTPVTATNVAGNPATAFGFAVKPSNNDDRYDIYKLDENLSEAYDINLNKYYRVTCTYMFNMYAEGDAILYFGSGKGLRIFEWLPNGDVYITRYDYESGSSIRDSKPACNLPRGQWYHVAYTLDRASNRGELYINGNRYVSETGYLPSWNYYKGISLCLAGSSEYTQESVGDRVLFSDVEYHEGFYYRDNQDIKITDSTNDCVIDTDNNVIYTQNIDTVDALKAAVLAGTDASAVKVYEDNSFAAQASELADSNIVFITSANGIRYENYTLKPMSELPAPQIELVLDTYVVEAKAKILEVNDGLDFWIATYTDSNKLINVKKLSITSSDVGTTVSHKLAYGENATKVKSFIWRNGFKPVAAASGIVPQTSAEPSDE